MNEKTKKNQKKIPWRIQKMNVEYFSTCYKATKARLENNRYDVRLVSNIELQTKHDLDFLVYVTFILEMCKKENRHFLDAVYFGTNEDKMYYESLARSTFNRIRRKAIEDFNDCLNKRIMIKSL